MRLSLMALAFGFVGIAGVLPAAAMSPGECLRMQKSLATESVALKADYQDLQDLAERAEEVGDDFAAAKEESGFGDPETEARAKSLGETFRALKQDVADRNEELMAESEAFNTRQKQFKSACKAYIK